MARLNGRWYAGNGGFRQIPDYGTSLGTASVPDCGDDDGFVIDAVRIEGIDPEVAFAAPDFSETVIFIAEDAVLPAALSDLRREPTCDEPGPVRLRGPWLGIVQPNGKTETDLIPPYDLEMRVEEASVPSYERAYITIHVGAELGEPLSRDDLRSSLWEGGTLTVSATCRGGEYRAQRVAAAPPSDRPSDDAESGLS